MKLVASAETHTSFNSEQTLSHPELAHFWQKITTGELNVTPEIKLVYMAVIHPCHKHAVVISNGRVESYLKYQEMIYDLYRLGYSVYAIDHRGQGLSSRLTSNPHQGHVGKFDDYVDDFKIFIDTIVKPAGHDALVLVGHSMGATIGTLYLQKSPSTFKAAVFSAPMYGIKLPLNKRFIRWLAKLWDNGSPSHPNYVIGGKDYSPATFKRNDLTHSELRYDNYRRLYQRRPELQLGSPTNRWLVEAIDAADRAVVAAKESLTPILVLQAQEDTIVDNDAQDRAASNSCQIVEIAMARHEIFMEKDTPRNQALSLLNAFLGAHR
jgi:lysophospholipase